MFWKDEKNNHIIHRLKISKAKDPYLKIEKIKLDEWKRDYQLKWSISEYIG